MRKILFWFLFFFYFNGYSQKEVVSEKEFEKLRFSIDELEIDFENSATISLNKLFKIAKSLKSQQLLANSYATMAIVKSKLSLPEEALQANQKSFLINNRLDNKTEIAKNFNIFGQLYFRKANYVDATKYYLKALEIGNELKLNKSLQNSYRGLADINRAQNKLIEAINYAKKAIEIEKMNPDQMDLADNSFCIGTCYASINKAQLADKYFTKAFEIYKKNNMLFSLANVLVKRSDIYYEIDPLKSIKLQLDAQKILDIVAPNRLTSAFNMVYLGEAYFHLAQNDSLLNEIKNPEIPKTKSILLLQAENYYNKGLILAQKNKNTEGILATSGLISDLQAYKGDYKNAYKNLQYKFKYNDSLFSQKNKNAIAKLESEKVVLELKSKNEKKSNLNKILIGSSIGLLLLGFLGLRNFRNKQKLQNLKITELEKDKQLLAIDAMLKGQEEERGRIAKDLHDGLGGLLSGTKLSFTNMKENLLLTPENAAQFEKSLSMLDTTIADLRKVAHNLMPEALVKFGLNDALKDFCSSIQLASNITVDYQKIGIDRKIGNTAETFIYRIIQELVNNAVKHSQATEILVQIAFANAKIIVTVEDNGKGYDKNLTTSGDGLDNIAYRVKYLNGTIDTVTSPNNGTSVNIELNA